MKIFGRNFVLRKTDLTSLNLFGEINVRDQTIRVEERLHPEGQIQTVLHEMIEAIFIANEIQMEHSVISTLDNGLYSLLTENGVDLSPLVKEIA